MNQRTYVQRALSCGFNAGYAHLEHRNVCCAPAVHSYSEHVYDMNCSTPLTLTIDRVVPIRGVDNALFIVGDVTGYRMGRNYVVEMPGEAINVTSGNYPTYLLLKDGNLHTLGFSTGNIEAFLRQNNHMFSRDGILGADMSFFQDYAPQDQSVEGMGDDCAPTREFRFRIISNTTINDASTSIEISVWECGEFIEREIWYLIPCRCENGQTFMGANFAPWDITPKTCGEMVRIPGRSTNNGQFIFANHPGTPCGGGCGHGYRGGRRYYNGYGYNGYGNGYYR